MKTCITCKPLEWRDTSACINLGVFVSIIYEHDCETYVRATEAAIIKRAAWWDQNKTGINKGD